jgi:hypothetical protein
MWMQTRDFVDVVARARDLGCPVPVRIALLPGNFSTAASAGEFCYHAATSQVRSAWRSVGLDDEGPEPTPAHARDPGSDTPSTRVPLAVFFGTGLRGGPAWCLTVALGMVSSVLLSYPCCAGPREIRFDVVVERPGGGYACLEYRGDAYELVALAKEVRGIWAGK